LLLLSCLSPLAGCFVECGAGTEEVNKTCVPVTVEDTAAGLGVPSILSFTTNVATIEEGESVVFTAIVTHPEGIDNLIGGVLQSGGGASYGAFASSADEGAYQMSVSWWDTNQVNPIDLDKGSDGSRPFNAVFYDVDGDSATATVDVGISCGGQVSCDGVCGVSC
jgi:hypothetical protein